MFRALTLTFALCAISTSALAHPDPKTPAEKSITKMERPQLPSETDIQDAIRQMPDMNAVMGDMIDIMQDERFRADMENSARAFGDRLERSGALEAGENGMPDFNSAFAVMLETFSDEDAMGGLMDTMMGLADVMEKHAPVKASTTESEAAPE